MRKGPTPGWIPPGQTGRRPWYVYLLVAFAAVLVVASLALFALVLFIMYVLVMVSWPG